MADEGHQNCDMSSFPSPFKSLSHFAFWWQIFKYLSEVMCYAQFSNRLNFKLIGEVSLYCHYASSSYLTWQVMCYTQFYHHLKSITLLIAIAHNQIALTSQNYLIFVIVYSTLIWDRKSSNDFDRWCIMPDFPIVWSL